MNFTRSLTTCCLVALSFFGGGCASSGFDDIKVESEANPKANFDGYDSYAWVAAAAIIRDPDLEWTPPGMNIGAEIVHLVNRELRAAGKTEVSESPDFLVLYAVGVDMKALDVVVDEDGGARFEETPSGGVLVLFLDPVTQQVLWAGGATAELTEEPTVEIVKKRLDYAISEMFKKTPF